MITRRNFIVGTSATAIAALILPKNLFAMPGNKMIGIQLYTIRDLVNKDFKGTLKMLSEIGYQTIEAAGYADRKFYGMSCQDYKSLVIDLGLIPISSHAGVTLENASQVIDDHLEAGISYLVVPSMPNENRESLDGYLKIAEDFNKIGELCKNSGIKFGYHNHAFEFEEIQGMIPFDILIENTSPDLVLIELDIYWMIYGGGIPIIYFEKYPGRFKLWHVKDMDDSPMRESTEIGSGTVDFKGLFEYGVLSGLEYYFVEQEAFRIDPIKSITRSFDFLKTI